MMQQSFCSPQIKALIVWADFILIVARGPDIPAIHIVQVHLVALLNNGELGDRQEGHAIMRLLEEY